MAGYHARHVPGAVAYHLGQASFGEAFGRAGCDVLALRNILLFQWKNLRHPLHWLWQVGGYPSRLALDLLRAPLVNRARRWAFLKALRGAWARRGLLSDPAYRAARSIRREREYFHRYHPTRINVFGDLAEARHPLDASPLLAVEQAPSPSVACAREESAWH
jgi:hypothetical protein